MKKKTVSHSWSSNTEASSAELCPGSRDKHVTAMVRTEVYSTGGVDQRGADVFEVGWTGATDAVKCGSRNLELNPLDTAGAEQYNIIAKLMGTFFMSHPIFATPFPCKME